MKEIDDEDRDDVSDEFDEEESDFISLSSDDGDSDSDDPRIAAASRELITTEPLPPDRNTYRDLYPHKGRPKKFTHKERKFVRYYFVFNGNQTKAAEAAGYGCPKVAGSVVMKRPHIRAAIDQNAGHHLESQGLTAYRTLEELRRLTLFNPKDLYDGDGNLKEVKDLPDEVASALATIETAIGLDPELGPVKRIKYKSQNKASAIKTTLTYLGLMPKRIQLNGEITTSSDEVEWFEYCTLEEKETIHDIMVKARGRMSAQANE